MSTFNDPDLWLGSYVELALEVSSASDERAVRGALAALARGPGVLGVWSRRESLGSSRDRFDVARVPVSASWPVGHGLFQVGERAEVGFVVVIVRERGGSAWVDLCIPTGMLERVYEVDHPLARATNPWLEDLERRLEAVGRFVHRESPFELALIGEEVSGRAHAARLDRAHVAGTTCLLPEALARAIGVLDHVRARAHGLCTVVAPR